MPSGEDYDSDCDYDARPEAGRVKRHLDSDESDRELSSNSRRLPPFLNDDGDDDDEVPIAVEDNTQRDRSSSPSVSETTVNPIRQPTAFAAPDPKSSSGPIFYYKDRSNTPTHAAVSADGTSMFCVEGYVNTPELSAGRGGGLSQGLPANGPYRSLFRAGSRSESRASASNLNQKANANANATATAAPALHVLAEAAQSPEALSPVSATASSPAPAHAAPPAAPISVPAASKKRSSRKPSPLIASSSPASSVAQLDSTPVALRPSPVASVNASSSSSQSHVVIEPSPPAPQLPRARPSGATNKGKHREKGASGLPETQVYGNGEADQRYGRIPLPSGRQPSKSPFSPVAEPREMEYAAQDCPRNLQNKNKNKNRAASSHEMDSLLQAPQPAAVDDGSYGYDHAEGDYCPSYYEAEPSGASEMVHEGGQSLSPPQAVVNHHPASAHTTASNESSPAAMANSRSVTPGTKPRMVTLLIEDRRHGTDELAEVHVPLKTTSEGCLWADAKDVCAALQSGPSRIDGPAKVFTMRGKYRQTFLRVSVDGEEMMQSANLKVETNRTLPIVVEAISDPRVVTPASFLGSNAGSLVGPGPCASVMNTAHPLTPVSSHLGLDGIHTTLSEVGQWPGSTRKRKRETSLNRVQQSPFGSPVARSMSTSHEQYHSRSRKSRRSNPISPPVDGYMSDSPPAVYRSQRAQRRRDQTHSGSRLDRSGYETNQPSSSVGRARPSSGSTPAAQCSSSSDRGMSSLLQPPPTPVEGSQRMHDKVVSFLQDKFVEDTLDWNEFTRDRAHVGSLSNAVLLRKYWFAQGRLDTWVGSRLPKHLNYKKVEIGHVLDALGVTEDWYRECNETLSLVIAYGEGGERWESPRAVAACRDRAPPKSARSSHGAGSPGGPTDLLLMLREVHEEYCERIRGRIGQGRASSVESM